MKHFFADTVEPARFDQKTGRFVVSHRFGSDPDEFDLLALDEGSSVAYMRWLYDVQKAAIKYNTMSDQRILTDRFTYGIRIGDVEGCSVQYKSIYGTSSNNNLRFDYDLEDEEWDLFLVTLRTVRAAWAEYKAVVSRDAVPTLRGEDAEVDNG